MVAQENFDDIKKFIQILYDSDKSPPLDQNQYTKKVWKSKDINDFELEIKHLVNNLK